MELFNYLLKVSACSALFFAFYLLVLRKLTFFKVNRFYLLLSLVVSFIIPALQFTIVRETAERTAIAQPINLQDVDLEGQGYKTPILVGTGPIDHEVVPFDWFILLPYLYSGVVVCLLLMAAWRLFQLLKHTNEPVKKINGLKLVSKRNGFTNCSFFNYVFIDENSLTQAELAVLLAHEEVHAKQYHSIDKLILMMAKAFLWFNPIIYLYDKALEQMHEYEADYTTSQNVGTETYATLLLKLAVSKSSNPLIHNFVKSPIKQRIKMLFNSKSKNMKKLIYLLVLPIGLGLIWGFTIKVTHRIKPLMQDPAPKLQDSLMGKTFKGKVMSFEKTTIGEVLNLKLDHTMLKIGYYEFKDKVKIGEEISVTIMGKISSPPPPIGTNANEWNKNYQTIAYMPSKVVGSTWNYTYKTPKYAFLYESNRARYAWSKIKAIEKNANGTISKIVLNDEGFTINLNVAAQQFKSNDFKEGDSIVVKFIGEKLIGKKTYSTDKMIALYSWPKKYELINKALYSKFYHENGAQKVYNKLGQLSETKDKTVSSATQSIIYPKPILVSSSTVTVNNITKMNYLKDAVMKVFNGDLVAKEVDWDMEANIITARGAKFTTERGKVIESDLLTFNNMTGAFSANYRNEVKPASAAYNLLSKLSYSATDSIKVSKVMDEGIILHGNVKMKIDDYSINGKIVTVNRNSNTITAYSGSVFNKDKLTLKADVIEFDLLTKEAKTGKHP